MENNERDLLYKVLFEMKKDVHSLKEEVENLKLLITMKQNKIQVPNVPEFKRFKDSDEDEFLSDAEIIEESLSIEKREIQLITLALRRNRGDRKASARELGIAERTLYRKINEYKIKE